MKYEQAKAIAAIEIWQGKAVPKNRGIAERKFNLRRENSNHGRGNRLLVEGETYPPLFKPYNIVMQEMKEMEQHQKNNKEIAMQNAVREANNSSPRTKREMNENVAVGVADFSPENAEN